MRASGTSAKISRSGDDFLLEDLKSRNGTLLNELPLADRRALADGDRVQICDVTLVFHDDRPGKKKAPASALVNPHDSSYGALYYPWVCVPRALDWTGHAVGGVRAERRGPVAARADGHRGT